MATTFSADKVATGVMTRTREGVNAQWETFAVAAALVVADVIQMIKIPKGATILDVILDTTDLDTDGTPAIVLEVGIGDDTDKFIAASTVGQAGGVAHLNNKDGHLYKFTEDDTIDVKVATAPDAGAAGTIKLGVLYSMDS